MGAEIHRNQGVQAEGGLEPKEPRVGMLNSSLMVTDPGSGNRSTDPGMLEGSGVPGGGPGLSHGQKVEGLRGAEDDKERPL